MDKLSFKEDILSQIDVWEGWRDDYKKYVPRFIHEAKTKADWYDWDKDTFRMFFLQRGKHCVASLKQGYFTKEEISDIKGHWGELSPMLKILAENQSEPQWETYKLIKEFLRKFTKQDRRSATNRLIASLQPNLFCTIVQENHLWDLYRRLQKYGCTLPEYVGGNWFKNSYSILRFFKEQNPDKDIYDIVTLPWQTKVLFDEENWLMQNRQEKMNTIINLLKDNKNIIFNGAPGTGKTYLARQIAAWMIYGGHVPDNFEEDAVFKQHCGFVQFHPSYDYTDFVEGLRPIIDEDDKSGIGFERKDGVFKEFCAVAMKGQSMQQLSHNFESAWTDLLDKVKSGIAANNLLKIGSWNYGLSSKDSLKYTSLTAPSGYSFTITKKNIYDVYRGVKARPSGAFQKDMEDIVAFMKEECRLENYKEERNLEKDDKPFIFIIDEINRGEISKIFGELFFSIDPGYRGIKGRVKTQYQNMITDEDDPFKDGFYVPENVYIIGTMNDIDRSVECLDFAMRRRFAFKEITAEESADNMKLDFDAKERMKHLNDAISSIDGLDSSYHIGASYFLNEKDYDKLWKLKLKGLLKEYLRGMSDTEEKLKNFENAYYNE